jgi:hypothetical protein
LEILVHASLLVSASLVDKLVDWLDAYAHRDDTPRLREMIMAIRLLG